MPEEKTTRRAAPEGAEEKPKRGPGRPRKTDTGAKTGTKAAKDAEKAVKAGTKAVKSGATTAKAGTRTAAGQAETGEKRKRGRPRKAVAEAPAAEAVEAEAPAVEAPVVEAPAVDAPVVEAPVVETAAAEAPVVEAPAVEAPVVEAPAIEAPEVEAEAREEYMTPRRSVAFIGSECYPFVKTGGLGDVMYALPKALVKQNCDVKVILPRYRCIPWEYQEKMVYRGAFDMDLCADGKSFYVGIMEYVWDGVVYDFIDNEEFFGWGNPYTNLVDDIPKYCFFAKAALAALNYMDWIPDIIHCHDWQAALTPVYLRTMFNETKLASAVTVLTIHNLKFQGIYSIPHIRYWSGLPDYVFNKDALTVNWVDANMLKGGLTYANAITTVSPSYAGEIQTPEYGEGLDAHLRYHSGKLVGIVNGIDCQMWDPATDASLRVNYSAADALEKKRENKTALQEELGLEVDGDKLVIGLISRLTDQKGLDLVNAIMPQIVDEFTEVVILGTGERVYEDSFRYYEGAYKGSVCANIMYDEARSHRIYAGADALMVPSRFEPCGLTQLNAMRYGTVPIVRETGGLRDTVEPYNEFENTGNGFTFDRYEAGLLLDAINRAKTLYFTGRGRWDEMVHRDMEKNVSWDVSAQRYKELYLALKG